jgi:signal peptidase I
MGFLERISAASKGQWCKMILANLFTILFVIWSGYYVCLLLLFLFFDVYITKYIPWAAWKKSDDIRIRKVMEWVDAVGFALIAVYFINTFFFQNYQIPSSSLEKSLLVGDFLCVSKVSYGARSPMTPFSFPLVQHTFPILNTKSYLEKPQLEYKRLAGFGQVKHGDIVVFNYPSGDTVALNRQQEDYYVLCQSYGHDYVNNHPEEFGKIVYRPVDRRENYVKRCVGLPGDVLQLKNDQLFINGNRAKDPENMQLSFFVQTDGTPIPEKVFDELGISKEDYQIANEYGELFVKSWNLDTKDSAQFEAMGFVRRNGKLGLAYQLPLTQAMIHALMSKPYVVNVMKDKNDYGLYYPITYKNKNWGRANYGPLWIPKRGVRLHFDKNTDFKVAAYRRCIENYEGNAFDYRDGKVYINGKQADSYVFKLDYYFMMGDNRDNSADSRVWGFVPEDHIVGQPMFIWMSLNKDKGWLDGKIRWSRIFTSAHKQ